MTTEHEVSLAFEGMANPVRTLKEIREAQDEARARKLVRGMDPQDSVNARVKPKKVDHRKRTSEYYRRQGFNYSPCQTTGYMGQSQDLLGFLDALAFQPSQPLIGVQICSTGDAGAHIRKACSVEVDKRSNEKRVDNLRAWLGSGCRFVVIEWQKRPKIGTKEWFEVLHEVTEETIALVESRRRK